jgi:hypothetical protein
MDLAETRKLIWTPSRRDLNRDLPITKLIANYLIAALRRLQGASIYAAQNISIKM